MVCAFCLILALPLHTCVYVHDFMEFAKWHVDMHEGCTRLLAYTTARVHIIYPNAHSQLCLMYCIHSVGPL